MTRDEDGVAVVMSIGVAALLVFVALVGGGVAALVAGHRKVQSAADLAALAGATAAQNGRPACAVASHLAIRNGVKLYDCDTDGRVVLVAVELKLPAIFAGRILRARARAGPGSAINPAVQRTLPNTLVTDIRMATRSAFSRGTL